MRFALHLPPQMPPQTKNEIKSPVTSGCATPLHYNERYYLKVSYSKGLYLEGGDHNTFKQKRINILEI